MSGRISWLLAFSLATPLLVGCAEERDPINRVQANALDKTFFVGELGNPEDDPEFYWRNFVVDGSEAQSLVGIGSWSGIDRIRWDIQEHLLVARKAYAVSPGADDKGDAGNPDGTIVAAYPIDSHFDILRDYNPQTGEELNVVGENTSDRPWYERRHMRVDWSINLVDTPMWFDMFFGKVYGDIKVTPLAYYVAEPGHPNAPHFDAESGYFDVTSKFWVEPEHMYTPYTPSGTIPSCVLVGAYTGSAVDSCDPQEAVVRSSYLKVEQVDRDGDFEPLDNSKAALDVIGNPGGLGASPWVGILTAPRIGWDPQYGYTDATLKRYMHVHNIWQTSHQTRGSCKADADCGGAGACLPSGTCSVSCSFDARGDGDGNGTDDQCENANTGYDGNEGAQCSARNRCTIPYRDREVRTVGYWINQETPEALLDEVDDNGDFVSRGASEDIIYAWNQALKLAVAKAREVECRRTGGDRSQCHGEFFELAENGVDQIEMVSYGGWGIPKVKSSKDVLVLCHNPVRTYDDPHCGEAGYSARVGDLRHNFLFYWPYASRAPWGGIGNWSADPVTGQIIGASATTMGRSATVSAAMVRDIMMVANGELEMSDVVKGQTASKYQKELRDGRTPEVFTEAQIDAQIAAIDAKHAASLLSPTTVPVNEPSDVFKRQIKQQAARVAMIGQATPLQEKFEILAKAVSSTPAAADLINPNWSVDLFASSPGSLGKDAAGLLSPLAGADPGKVEDYRKVIDQRLAMRGVCFADQQVAGNIGNPDVQSVARYFKEKFSDDTVRELLGAEGAAADSATISKKRADLIYEHLWKESYKGIQLHEIGHSLGLLHQFASSYDSANYNPQYWQLRTNEGQSSATCNGRVRGAADTCMGPRYLDPETEDELGRASESRPGINYYAHTSTMEYQNERFFESVGLGQYDTFAMGALYGRVLETFDDKVLPVESQNSFGLRSWSQLSEDNLVVDKVRGLFGEQLRVGSVHYTEQARRMKVFDPGRCRPATDEEMARAEWRIVHGKVCAGPSKDHAHWDDFESSQAVPDDDPASWVAVKWHTAPGARGMAPGSVRWPYRYGTSDNAYIHTNPSDAGADVYETTVETIRKFEYSYPFTYFRRQRRDYFYPTIPGQTAYRFFERLRAVHWQVANTNAFLESFDVFDAAAADDNWHRPYVMAEAKIFDTLAKALLMPQTGPYNTPLTMVDSTRPLLDTDSGASTQAEFTLDTSVSRYVDPDYDSTPSGGGSWEYLDWIDHTGFTFEKALAALALADGRPNLMTISRENYLDGRDPYINFRSDMPQAVDRLLGGLLSSDWESIAPHVASAANPVVEVLDLSVAEPSRPANSTLVFPNLGYRQQVGALVFSHIFARLNTDLTLANKLRIWVSGLSGELNIPEEQQARFYNPESGITYIARRYGDDVIDGKTVDQGIGSRMLAHANALLAGTAERPGPFEVERDADGNPVLDDFGQAVLVLDDSGAPIATDRSEYLGEFRKYVGLLDASVQIARAVGYGPFNGLPGGTDDN